MILPAVFAVLTGCTALDQDARINFLEGQMKDALQKSAEWDVTSRNLRKQLADYGARIDSMQEQVQTLTGRIEELESKRLTQGNQQFPRRQTSREIRKLEDRLQYLEAKLEELGRHGVSVSPPLPLAGTVAPGNATLTKPLPQTPVVITSPVREQPARKAPEPSEEEQEYNQAMNALKGEQYNQAIRLYRKFIKKHPGSTLSDNAQYWIGESYYAQKKYEEAIIEFEEVAQKYPKGDKVASALVKEGLAFHELKDNKTAVQLLQKVIDLYPDSEEARLAGKKLPEMK